MEKLKILFWILVAIIFYTYIGYGILLYIIISIKKRFKNKTEEPKYSNYEPDVTLFITAYNESDFVKTKMRNALNLDYPKDKLHIVWVIDGSDDGTPELLYQYPNVTVYHESERRGKINAMNRGMKMVTTPIVVFSDANTMIGKEALKRIISKFNNPKVGCVSGEKRIVNNKKDNASGSGEGIYWKYESTLKKWDAEVYSAVGAAGELFAVRTALYRDVEDDTILDDFVISLRIAQKGYTIQYDPEAFAIESASANIKEELKRKIRISAGGIQAILRLKSLLNIFKYGVLTFQYVSHRVLRWTLTPVCLFVIIPVLSILNFSENSIIFGVYNMLFWVQVIFILFVIAGSILQNTTVKYKAIFIPYYFYIMNYSVILGFIRYIRKSQSVIWERATRAD